MSDYDLARQRGRRLFFCHYSQTLRTCPENYVIAVRTGRFCWRLILDSALWPSTIARGIVRRAARRLGFLKLADRI